MSDIIRDIDEALEDYVTWDGESNDAMNSAEPDWDSHVRACRCDICMNATDFTQYESTFRGPELNGVWVDEIQEWSPENIRAATQAISHAVDAVRVAFVQWGRGFGKTMEPLRRLAEALPPEPEDTRPQPGKPIPYTDDRPRHVSPYGPKPRGRR